MVAWTVPSAIPASAFAAPAQTPLALDLLFPTRSNADDARAAALELHALDGGPWFDLTRATATVRADATPGRTLLRISEPYEPWSWTPPNYLDTLATTLDLSIQAGARYPVSHAALGLEVAPAVLLSPVGEQAWGRLFDLPVALPLFLPPRGTTQWSTLIVPVGSISRYATPDQVAAHADAGLGAAAFLSRPNGTCEFRVRVTALLLDQTRPTEATGEPVLQLPPSPGSGQAGIALSRFWRTVDHRGRIRLEMSAGASQQDEVTTISPPCSLCNDEVTQALVTRQTGLLEIRLAGERTLEHAIHLGGEVRGGGGIDRVRDQGNSDWLMAGGMAGWLRLRIGPIDVLGTFDLARTVVTTTEDPPTRSFRLDAGGRLHILYQASVRAR